MSRLLLTLRLTNLVSALTILREIRETEFDSQSDLGYKIVANAYQYLANGPRRYGESSVPEGDLI